MKTIISYTVILSLSIIFTSCAWFSKEQDADGTDKYILAENYVSQGISHFKNEEDSLAVVSWQKALQIIPDDAEVHNFVGIAYHKMNKIYEASRAFRNAVKNDSSYYDAANNYGYTLFLLGKYPEAKEAFNLAVNANPQFEPALKNLKLVDKVMTGSLNIKAFEYAEAAADKEDYQEQIDIYKRAININPDYAKVHNNIAVAYYYEGMNDSAYYHLQQAVRLQKDYPEAINNLGYLNKIDQKYDIAIQLFLKAISLKPRYISALNNLGETYLEKGDKANAIKVFDTVLDLDSSDKTAQHYMAELKKEGE
ncbi:MAG: tetratricopeptide repeat protein [Calditrichae bacterium]|nr:tetratricopeptide repeat protein [Calditrichota bacterium]MCB9058915.1 tetratricopeptide repeat protein [Calditrichia bacterium]